MHRPRARQGEREDCAHSSRLDHGTEGLIIVHTRALGEAPEDPASLVALQGTIRPALMRPDPLAGHHIAARRTRHEVPRLVGKKSRILLFHRTMPVRIRQGIVDRGGYWRDPRLALGGEESLRPKNAGRPPSYHGMNMVRVPMENRRVVHGARVRWWRWRRRCRPSRRPERFARPPGRG